MASTLSLKMAAPVLAIQSEGILAFRKDKKKEGRHTPCLLGHFPEVTRDTSITCRRVDLDKWPHLLIRVPYSDKTCTNKYVGFYCVKEGENGYCGMTSNLHHSIYDTTQ